MYRRYRPLSIWREMNELQRELNRVFESYSSGRTDTAPSFPPVNVWADEESTLITAELPGMTSDDIEIDVLENTLTLSGEREAEELPEGARYHRQERGYGKFSRSIRLPYSVDVDNVEATFKNGVLEIKLPRTEKDRPKKIEVKVS